MNAAIEKVQGFLDQFGSAEEFVGWCEVQGVKGYRTESAACLVANAIETATGVEVSVGHGAWALPALGSETQLLPPALRRVPEDFDMGRYPHLEAGFPLLAPEVQRAIY